MQNNRKKICIVATVPYALVMFMKPHIAMLAEQYDVTLIANGVEQDFSTLLNENVRFVPVNIARKISLWRDVVSLFQLYRIFRKEQFDVVHSLMPKTGLLAMFAAFFVGVPHRIHTFTGQVWANKEGLARWGLKTLDKLIAKCATDLLTDGFPQRLFLIEQHIVEENKIAVLGNGSTRGIEAERFKPNLAIRHQIRSNLGISDNAVVYLFLGRLNKDKGIQDLAHAFAGLAVNMPHVHLLVAGPDEGGMDRMLQSILEKCAGQYHRVGFTNRPEDYMACADIFCLPSYREGFPSVIIESAAVGIPAVASNIYGVVDAVVDGETGILHQPKSIEGIKQALLTLTNDAGLRAKMSKQAMTRAHTFFATDILVNAMRKYYQNLLS
ncbi:glycosyltransferase family 4 protein [Methylotenera sp.]|uniref:glycosyltransferase family 4 protein n=2 Tax=Methylotenera sp. TaxID=2051956 RepID=UPI00271D031E|nr:glycosyltransferase family 4 protein [Methylotenera sp.]MDO9204847.1 glycosyltransferase family 4 protein [Methylotenera sp.]